MEEDHGEERVPPPGGDLRLAARAARRERAHLTRAPEPAGRRGLGPTRPTPLRGPDRATYTARAPGAVAQLAERLHGMQEVRGSSPLSSTTPNSQVRAAAPHPRTDRRGRAAPPGAAAGPRLADWLQGTCRLRPARGAASRA